MDVDAICKATMDVEKEKYRSEGRCYNCGQQGHLSCDCPNRKPRITAAVSTPAAPPAITSMPVKPPKEDEDTMLQRMAKAAIGLSSTQQEKLATFMCEKGVDFQ